MELTKTKISHQVDGESLVPLLKGGVQKGRSLYWHYPHYSNQGGFPGGAIRRDNWKLVERYEDGTAHLFNLSDDIGENHDVSKGNPDRVSQMRKDLHAWYKDVDAKFLRAKPNGPEPWQPGN